MAITIAQLSQMSEPERERALEDFVRAAKGKPNGQVRRLDAQIRDFETRYEMSSADMLEQVRGGVFRDTAETAKWLMLVRLRARVR